MSHSDWSYLRIWNADVDYQSCVKPYNCLWDFAGPDLSCKKGKQAKTPGQNKKSQKMDPTQKM